MQVPDRHEAEGAGRSSRLLVRPARADETGCWDELMATHHYLGQQRLVGESLRYVARSASKLGHAR